jgi:hypothetical protein
MNRKMLQSFARVKWMLVLVGGMSCGCATTEVAWHAPAQQALAGSLRPPPAKTNHLRELRINARDARHDELLASLGGRSVYTDAVLDPDAAADMHLVCIDRISSRQLVEVLKIYREVFKEPLVDPKTGEPLFDILTGKPLHANCSRQIRADLAGALQRFRGEAHGGVIDPVELRRYIEDTPSEGVALRRIAALQDFFGRLHLLGLSVKEEERARLGIIGRVCPNGLSVVQLEQAIAAQPDTFAPSPSREGPDQGTSLTLRVR